MTSKVVIKKSQIPIIQGTKPETRNAQLLVSTGIQSLDYFIGGGLPVGSVLLIEEDAYSMYSNIMFRYFVAEGVVNGHSLFVASQDSNPSKVMTELPKVVENSPIVKEDPSDSADMKIAWRYQNMKIMDSVGDNFGHCYDLTKTMDKEKLEKVNVKMWDGESVKCENDIFNNNAYKDLLVNIERTISEGEFLITQPAKKRNILRIAINSLGSRLWLSDSEDESKKDLLKFMYMLKALLRESFTAAIVTVPVLNFDDDETGVVQRLEHLSDVVIGLEAFAGSSRETNPVFKDYHGLLSIKKLASFNTLSNQDTRHNDLAFKLRRKNFLIEIMHLPPVFGNTAQREQDELASSGCGGISSNQKLEF